MKLRARDRQVAVLRRAQRARAFTLLEMIISIGLFIFVMSVTFAFYRRSLETREEGASKSRDAQLARVILKRMAKELRQASGFVPGYGTGVYGLEDRIEVNTLVIPDRKLTEQRTIRDEQLPGQFDLQQIRYYIAWDEENVDTNGYPRALGLARRANRTYLRDVAFRDEEEQATEADAAQLAWKEELYAPEIKFLEFRYFDGARWWDTWELVQGNSLPQIVQITIGFVPVPPESEEFDVVDEEDVPQSEEDIDPLPDDRYSTFVRLPQADLFFGSRLTREAAAFSESQAAGGL